MPHHHAEPASGRVQREKLLRKSFRLGESTWDSLTRLGELLYARRLSAEPNATQGLRYAAWIAEAFDADTFDKIYAITSRLLATGRDVAPTPADAIRFAIDVAATSIVADRGPPATSLLTADEPTRKNPATPRRRGVGSNK